MARTIQLAVAAAQLRPRRRRPSIKASSIPSALRRRVRRRPDRHRAAGAGRRRPRQRQLPAGPRRSGEMGRRKGLRSFSRCGCSSTCPTCWPATSRSCTTPAAPTTASPRATRPACWRWARPTASCTRDQADFFLVGGAESKINPLSLVRQCLFEQLSRRNDAPEKACRPFDRHRDGLVLGEGAGVFVLEESGTRPQARRPDLRGGRRLRLGVRPRASRATAWRGPCGPP